MCNEEITRATLFWITFNGYSNINNSISMLYYEELIMGVL